MRYLLGVCNMFSYIWCVGQGISAALQYFYIYDGVIHLHWHILPLSKNSSCDLDIALGHISISIICRLIIPCSEFTFKI